MAYIVIPPDFIPYVSTIVNIVISFTPLISYGSTVLSIRRTKTSQGFSIDICGTMLVSSILRIFYYFNDPFEITLLRQCFVMVFIQTILLKFALKYRSEDAIHFEKYHSNWCKIFNKFKEIDLELIENSLEEFNNNSNNNNGENKFSLTNLITKVIKLILKVIENKIYLVIDLSIELFKNILRLFDYHYIRPFNYWQWRKPINYWKFLIGFIIFLILIQVIFNKSEYIGIIFGSISFMVESSLPLPQILLFQRLKHVENFKIILLLSWLGGDVTKISYLFYGTDNVGFIFVFAAFFQMSLNFVITYQFFYYKFNPSTNNEIEENSYQMSYLPISHRSSSSNNSINNNSNSNHIRNPSRSLSLSLNGVIPNINKSNLVIPQQQHFQHKKTLSNVIENNLVNEKENHLDNNDNNEIDLGENVDISNLINNLDNNEINFNKINQLDDKEVDKKAIELNGDGVVEVVRSRNNTYSNVGKHNGDVFSINGINGINIKEDSKISSNL